MLDRYLIVTTDPRIDHSLVEAAIAEADARDAFVHVAIPAVLPSTLPISAAPARLTEQLNGIQQSAHRALLQRRGRGRIEILPCRDVPSALQMAARDERPDHIILVGGASRRLRRTARGIAPHVLSPRARGESPAAKALPLPDPPGWRSTPIRP